MPIVPEEIAEGIWTMIDKDNKGEVGVVEFFEGVNAWMRANDKNEITKDECIGMFCGIDQSNDSIVTRKEFIDDLCRKKEYYQGLEDDFKSAEADGKPGLSREEFRAFALRLGVCCEKNVDQYVCRVFDTVDRDNSGTLSFDEFIEANAKF